MKFCNAEFVEGCRPVCGARRGREHRGCVTLDLDGDDETAEGPPPAPLPSSALLRDSQGMQELHPSLPCRGTVAAKADSERKTARERKRRWRPPRKSAAILSPSVSDTLHFQWRQNGGDLKFKSVRYICMNWSVFTCLLVCVCKPSKQLCVLKPFQREFLYCDENENISLLLCSENTHSETTYYRWNKMNCKHLLLLSFILLFVSLLK